MPQLSVEGTVEIERLTDVLFVGRPVHGEADSTVGLFKLTATARKRCESRWNWADVGKRRGNPEGPAGGRHGDSFRHVGVGQLRPSGVEIEQEIFEIDMRNANS